jgi:G3E family GTPase
MSARTRDPIFVLTGFLGSGKTVLLNGLLKQPGFADSAVIVNEFGEIGLDHLLISTAQENIVLLDAGCLCCAVLGSLKETLADLHHRRARGEVPPFRRVMIETTGLADPGPILQSIMRDPLISHFYRLAGVVCLVDVLHAQAQLDDQPEARAQIAFADRLVVTKTDLSGEEVPERLRKTLRDLNATAEILVASNGEVGAERLLSTDSVADAPPWLAGLPDESSYAAHADHHDHEEGPQRRAGSHLHDTAITSESFWVDHPATWSGLAAWTEVLRRRYGRDLLRCKGLVKVEGLAGPVALHGVQTLFDTRRMASWPGDDRRTRLVLIGRGLDRSALQRTLGWLQVPEGTQPPLDADTLPPDPDSPAS